MKTARSLFQRWRSLFRKEQLDRDLSDELAAHLEMHIADNLRAGLSPEVSRRNALLRLGGVEQTKESYRERRGLPLLETLWQDLRFVQTMEQRIAASLGPRRSAIDLLSFFAMLGVTLSAIGLFALVRYSVVQRTQEIGVRIALGALRHRRSPHGLAPGLPPGCHGARCGVCCVFRACACFQNRAV